MKTGILSMATACAMLFASSTQAFAINDSISQATDQRIEKSAKKLAAETIELTAEALKDAKKNTSDIKKYVDSRLDDTILLDGEPVKKQRSDNELIEYQKYESEQEMAYLEKSFRFVEKLGEGFTVFAIVVAILIIVASYLKRRQKYKVIEKAIENNYPLPPGFLGKDVRPTTIQHIHYTQGANANGNSVQNIKNVTEFKVNDWANFRSGIKWCAWGIAFMLFFLIVDAPIWVFALIPIIIGIGKIFAAYKIQQSIDNANRYTEESGKSENNESTPPPFQNKNNEINEN